MLSTQERRIVEEFKRQIAERFPGQIADVLVYGSKARGDDRQGSDIDILVITTFDDWRKVDEIRSCGYDLDWEIGLPFSIQVMSEEHFNRMRANRFQFARNVERDAIRV